MRFVFTSSPHPLVLHSFPTRRSSDLVAPVLYLGAMGLGLGKLVDANSGHVQGLSYLVFVAPGLLVASGVQLAAGEDRKSTRLNSSHSSISYAVFCLKKKTDGRLEALE